MFATTPMHYRKAETSAPATSNVPAPAPLRLRPPTPEEEREIFDEAVREVEKWLASPRWSGIKVGDLLTPAPVHRQRHRLKARIDAGDSPRIVADGR